MIFFFDQNISIHLVKLLKNIYRRNNLIEIVHIEDKFDKDVEDVFWINEVATWKDKPIIISCDHCILVNEIEWKALKESNLTFILLPKDFVGYRYDEQGWKLITTFPVIAEYCKQLKNPSIHKIRKINLNQKISIKEFIPKCY